MQDQKLETFFTRVMSSFGEIAPNARAAYDRLDPDVSRLDHVAFRTLSNSEFNLDTLDGWLTSNGYVVTGEYAFKTKHVRAKSYSNTNAKIRRVFLSELLVDEMSPAVELLLHEITSYVLPFYVSFPWCQVSWPKVSEATYKTILKESDYAAWVITNGLMPNHLALHHDQRVSDAISILEADGHKISNAGGVIKGGPAMYLEQSSTVADTQFYTTSDGIELRIPTAYCEFTNRWIDPATGEIFDKFIEPSADKIFESTDQRQAYDALAIVKPDAISRGLSNTVLKALIDEGLEVVEVLRTKLHSFEAQDLYLPHKGKPFYDGLVHFMTSGPISIVKVRGIDCAPRLRRVVESVRKLYAMSVQENVIHGSDSIEAARRETSIFFPKNDP